MGRAPCCEKVGLKKGRWTSEEDKILINYIAEHGEGSWKSMPKNAGLLRCGKSCRLRWVNYLKADLKRGDFTQEDEDTIIKLHASFGNRWSLIAGHLPGRTDNEIKNYWNTHLKRKLDTLDHSNNNNHSPMPIGTNKRKKDSRLGKNEQHTSSSIDSMTSDEKSDQSDQQGPGKLRTDSVSVKEEEGARGCVDGIKLEDFDNELWESVKEICPWDWSNVDQLAEL